jgi:hypothetical protein
VLGRPARPAGCGSGTHEATDTRRKVRPHAPLTPRPAWQRRNGQFGGEDLLYSSLAGRLEDRDAVVDRAQARAPPTRCGLPSPNRTVPGNADRHEMILDDVEGRHGEALGSLTCGASRAQLQPTTPAPAASGCRAAAKCRGWRVAGWAAGMDAGRRLALTSAIAGAAPAAEPCEPGRRSACGSPGTVSGRCGSMA